MTLLKYDTTDDNLRYPLLGRASDLRGPRESAREQARAVSVPSRSRILRDSRKVTDTNQTFSFGIILLSTVHK